jgi:hypothetical protein
MRRYFKWFLAVSSLVAIPFIYQNCAPAPLEDKTNGSLCVAADLNSCADAPFGYETKVDTISYMSVSDNTSTSSDFFTFRINSTNTNQVSGLKIRPEFLNYVSKLSIDDKIEVLMRSELNLNARYNLSVRQSTFLNSSPYSSAGFYSLANLKDSSDLLIANGESLKTLNGVPIVLNINETAGGGAKTLSSAIINTDYRLSANFTHGNSVTALISAPGTVNSRQAYGYGFKLTFAGPPDVTPAANVSTNYPTNAAVVTGVKEFNLETGAETISSWQCSSAIIIANSGSPPSICQQAGQAGANNIIPRSLTSLTWDKVPNGTNSPRCVYPKNAAALTFYDASPWHNNSSASTTCGAKTCPHYVSVCTRN